MKQLFNKSGDIVIEEVPAPTVRPGRLLVANMYSVISQGTESQNLENMSGSLVTKAWRNPELVRTAVGKVKEDGIKSTLGMIKAESGKLLPMGYSSSGLVIAKGENAPGIEVGDLVACAGEAHHAEIVSIPVNLAVKIPENVPPEQAAFMTLGSIALQGVRRSGAHLGSVVAVVGLGLIGQLTVQILAAAGCRVVAADLDESRVKLAGKTGAHLALKVEEGYVDKVVKFSDGMGADAVLICAATSSQSPVQDALAMSRRKGKVVVVGDVPMNIDRKPFYEKELDFLISTSYGPGRYDPTYEEHGLDYPVDYVRWTQNRNMAEFLRLISHGRIDLKPLISKVFPIEKAAEAYQYARSADERPLGVLFKYREAEKRKAVSEVVVLSEKTAHKGTLNIGILGAGSFAKTQHLPNMSKLTGVDIRAIASNRGGNAKQLGKRYGASYCTTDYDKILSDRDVHMVLIATRHNLHAPLAVKAIRSGKAVFTEKPMAMNREEVDSISEVISASKVPFAVGFNRRYAPLAIRLKKSLAKGKPVTINYTVNAGILPKDHWVHDPVQGGGRLIGEACHFFDFFCWLTDSKPVSVITHGISGGSSDDNFVSTVKFQDGSVGNLTYSSEGHSSHPKEMITVFSGGSVMVINDFANLEISGPKPYNQRLKKADKGIKDCLHDFIKVAKGERTGHSYNSYLWPTLCTLKARDSMKTGKTESIDG
jgi:predicted dehydrogenase